MHRTAASKWVVLNATRREMFSSLITYRWSLCRLGWHRDIVRESRTYHRKRTDEGESIDAYETRQCACGDVSEYEHHTLTKHSKSENQKENSE